MEITLESLGLSKEDIQDRIIDQLCSTVLSGHSFDEDGEKVYEDSQFKKKLEARLLQHIDATVAALAEKHVLPNVTQYVENLVIQQTNQWGEKKGQQVTFIEYLTQRADAYLREDVNHDGVGKGEGSSSYNWSKSTTRIAYMVNKHLQYSIQTAMTAALATANSAIAGGIEAAVKIKLEEVVKGLQIAVKTK